MVRITLLARMGGLRLLGVSAAAVASMAILASPAWASDVPALSGPQVTVAGSAPPANALPGPTVYPLRPRDAAQAAQLKAAADAGYSSWQATRGSSAESPIAASPFAAIVSLNQPGMNFSVDNSCGASGCNIPPDTTGAIGPNYYLEFVNSEVAVYNRTTLASPPVSKLGEDAFTGSSSTCDGQIKWDNQAQRWLYWSLDCKAPLGRQGWSIGFSKTKNPLPLAGTNTTSAWCKYH